MKVAFFGVVALLTLQHVAASSIEDEMACAMNAERRKAGLDELLLAPCLCTSAHKHSAMMAVKKMLEHILFGEGDADSRIRSACGSSVGATAENISWNRKDVAESMRGWMRSSGHRSNILSSKYTHFGGAMVKGNGPYWTQNFASGISGGRKPNCSGDNNAETEPETKTPAPAKPPPKKVDEGYESGGDEKAHEQPKPRRRYRKKYYRHTKPSNSGETYKHPKPSGSDQPRAPSDDGNKGHEQPKAPSEGNKPYSRAVVPGDGGKDAHAQYN